MYYFTELKLKAFGQHVNRTIKFKPGLNVIKGDSEKGKTTIIRALYLLIENQPRKAEKIWQSWLTDAPLSIQLTDDAGNVIKRKGNKYYINGGEPLKAFGTAVPEPVRELLNFKEINWQRQLDVHYLLFSTGGSAGKLLNSATGMGDQEAIIEELKSKLSHSKSEIKRYKKNNDEHQSTVDRLKNIVRYRIKADGITNLQEDVNELDDMILALDDMIHHIKFINQEKVVYESAKPFMIKLKSMMIDLEEVDEFNQYISDLNSIIKKIEDIKLVKPDTVKNMLKIQHGIQSKYLELISLNHKTKTLNEYIHKIEDAHKTIDKTAEDIQIKQAEFDQSLSDLGYCPLCNRKVDDGSTCCR